MEIRYSKALDELFLNQVLSDPKIAPFIPASSPEELKMFKGMWMYFAVNKAGLTILHNDQIVGMGVICLMPYQKVKHHAALQMVIHPAFSKHGYGSSLLKNLIHLAKDYLKLELVFLELISPSPYVHFFEKRGFKTYAIQKGYVDGPAADKTLMVHRWV